MKHKQWLPFLSAGLIWGSPEGFAIPIKIRTFEQNFPKGQMIGSAQTFQWQGNTYAITAEHVTTTSDIKRERAQTIIENEVLSLNLIASDYGRGLSLYQFEKSLNHPDLSIQEEVQSPLQIQGFPKKSDQMATTSAHVFIAQSHRHLFMVNHPMIEVDQTTIEDGMSGSPVFSGKNWIGLLSHQIFYPKPGQAKQVGMIHADLKSDHGFVIPALTIREFLESVFQKKGPIAIRLSAPHQPLRVLYGEFEFRWDATERTENSAQEIALMPNEGGDPVGVTTPEILILESVPVKVSLSTSPLARRPHSTPSWYDRLYTQAQTKRFTTLNRFVIHPQHQQSVLNTPRNIEEWSSLLHRGAIMPVFPRTLLETECTALDLARSELHSVMNTLGKNITPFVALQEIRELLNLFESTGAENLSQKDLDSLLFHRSSQWSEIDKALRLQGKPTTLTLRKHLMTLREGLNP